MTIRDYPTLQVDTKKVFLLLFYVPQSQLGLQQ